SLAILAPEKNAAAEDFARVLADQIQKSFDVIDLSMADAAFRSADVAEPFNQTVESAKNLAEIIGCEYFILIRTTNQRRAGIGRPDYFEASAAVFLVSGRTGKLLSFRLYNREA